MGALAFLELQEVPALSDLRAGDERHSAFPAARRNPKLSLRVEELHLGHLVFDFDGLDIGVVVNECPGEEVVHLDLASLKGDEQELDVDIRPDNLCFLSLDLFVRVFIFRINLISLSNLIVSGFDLIAP